MTSLQLVHDNPAAETKKWLSCADTAKLIRAALKKRFPAVKFSVRSHVYSGGASINVKWTSGPEAREVEAVANAYSGARFDGQIDLKSHADHWLMPDGSAVVASCPGTVGSGGVQEPEGNRKPEFTAQRVHFGADYIFCTRMDPKEVA